MCVSSTDAPPPRWFCPLARLPPHSPRKCFARFAPPVPRWCGVRFFSPKTCKLKLSCSNSFGIVFCFNIVVWYSAICSSECQGRACYENIFFVEGLRYLISRYVCVVYRCSSAQVVLPPGAASATLSEEVLCSLCSSGASVVWGLFFFTENMQTQTQLFKQFWYSFFFFNIVVWYSAIFSSECQGRACYENIFFVEGLRYLISLFSEAHLWQARAVKLLKIKSCCFKYV